MVKRSLKHNGFTLVEMMVALLVSSVVLAAVATLAGAASAADTATQDLGREQAQLRQVSIRLGDLVRRANRVMSASTEGFELWHDINADGAATADELTQIARGADGNGITVGGSEAHTDCQNVSFAYDAAAPDTRFITVRFQITENSQLQEHSVNARLRASDAHRTF